MQGSVLSVKKSTWLLVSIIINTILFILGSIISVFVYNQYDAWFFLFCIFVGFHLLLKSIFFKFDSCCYFGSLLVFVGIFYFYLLVLNLSWLYPVFIVLSFSVASFLTAYFFYQPFQYILALSLFFVTIGLIFFLIKAISIWIFLAIISLNVILLFIGYFVLGRKV